MKKKIALILACLVLTVSAASCSGSGNEGSSSESTVTSSAAGEGNKESSAEISEEKTESSEEKSSDESSEEEKSEDESSEEEKSEGENSGEKKAPEITGTEVDASWFDNAIFVGDSVTVGLSNYADNGCLGDADFLARECMGYHTAMFGVDHEYGIHPSYKGQKVMIEDGVQMIGKKNVFIMLGMNDISYLGVDGAVDVMKEFCTILEEKNPDIQVYIESVTPMISTKVREDYLNNENIALYNERIKEVCNERGYVYLDIASVVSDGNGNLRDDLCSDPEGLGHHFTSEGDRLWVEYLKTHVA